MRRDILRIILCFGLIALITEWSNADSGQCGYAACDLGKPDFLNIHLIPHTHDDVGWLKTVDQYYYGAKNYVQRAGVQYILDSVVQALDANPDRRFTYVEMAFFTRWWRAQTLKTREIVDRLVQTGRLQFVLGGWCMADEATVHYTDAIDQLTKGRDVLKHLFGDCGRPRVAWQIDPFGHSRDHARVFRDAGFDAVYFSRIDHREKALRTATKELELLWDTEPVRNSTAQGLFTHIMQGDYCHPFSFCFDDKCSDEPIQDDPTLHDYNVDRRVDAFIHYVDMIKTKFLTNHLLVPMGCDFTYENAHMNYKNMDKLIQYTNARQANGSKLHLLYSTPTCYTKAVNEAFAKLGSIPRRGGDFFPYASTNSAYWTGYFTSRPALKSYVRESSNLLTVCEQLYVSAFDGEPQSRLANEAVDALRRALGVLQHHDAVSGTEKQNVAEDYAMRLAESTLGCRALIGDAIYRLVPALSSLTDKNIIEFCPLLNISRCPATEQKLPYVNETTSSNGIYIMVYNPSGWSKPSAWIRVPVYIPNKNPKSVDIHLADTRLPPGESIPFQLVEITERTYGIPERGAAIEEQANMELVFSAASLKLPLPPMGFVTFHIQIKQRATWRNNIGWLPHVKRTYDMFTSDSTDMWLELSGGVYPVMVVIRNKQTGQTNQLKMELLYYFGETEGGQSSGAYVFLPKAKTDVQHFPEPGVQRVVGPCVNEVHLNYSSWATLIVRLYADRQLEVEWTIGPIPDDGGTVSREVIIRYTLLGEGVLPGQEGEFFTDSSGRRLIRRIRNDRSDWEIPTKYVEPQPITGNYYPVVNRIMLMGANSSSNATPMALAIYTDRAEGGTSLVDGQLDLMLHRRLMHDDGFGVAESLRENGLDKRGLIVRGKHIIRLDERRVIEDEDVKMAHFVSRPHLPLFVAAKHPAQKTEFLSWSGLNFALPDDVKLISLIRWPLVPVQTSPSQPDQLLLRLEQLKKPHQTDPVKLNIMDLFRGILITNAVQVVVTADQTVNQTKAERLHWPGESQTDQSLVTPLVNTSDELTILLAPGEISTFILGYKLL